MPARGRGVREYGLPSGPEARFALVSAAPASAITCDRASALCRAARLVAAARSMALAAMRGGRRASDAAWMRSAQRRDPPPAARSRRCSSQRRSSRTGSPGAAALPAEFAEGECGPGEDGGAWRALSSATAQRRRCGGHAGGVAVGARGGFREPGVLSWSGSEGAEGGPVGRLHCTATLITAPRAQDRCRRPTAARGARGLAPRGCGRWSRRRVRLRTTAAGSTAMWAVPWRPRGSGVVDERSDLPVRALGPRRSPLQRAYLRDPRDWYSRPLRTVLEDPGTVLETPPECTRD